MSRSIPKLLQEHVDEALELYRSSLATVRLIKNTYGESAERLRDISISEYKLSTVDEPRASEHLQSAFALIKEMVSKYGVNEDSSSLLRVIGAKLEKRRALEDK